MAGELSEVFSRSPDREIGSYDLVDVKTTRGREIAASNVSTNLAVRVGEILNTELESSASGESIHTAHPPQHMRDRGTGKFSFEYEGQRIEFRNFGELMNIGRSYDTVAEKAGLVAAYTKKFVTYEEDSTVPAGEKRPGPASALPHDYYKTPRDFLESGRGDCEDFAHGYREMLKGMGVRDDRMLAVHVLAPVKTILDPNENMFANHVFLAVKGEGGEYNRLDTGGRHERGKLEDMLKAEGFVPLTARTAGNTFVFQDPRGPTEYEKDAFKKSADVAAVGLMIVQERNPGIDETCAGIGRLRNGDECNAYEALRGAVQKPDVPDFGRGAAGRPH